MFPTINTADPGDAGYRQSKALAVADWMLPVTGLTEREAFSLVDLEAMPARTQIALHGCRQGWSAIAGRTVVSVAYLLARIGLTPEARFIVIRGVDGWWDSYVLVDALHPQTIPAYGMNGGDPPVAHGTLCVCGWSVNSATGASHTSRRSRRRRASRASGRGGERDGERGRRTRVPLVRGDLTSVSCEQQGTASPENRHGRVVLGVDAVR